MAKHLSGTCITGGCFLQADWSNWRVCFIGGHVLHKVMCCRRTFVMGEHVYFTFTCICNLGCVCVCV